MKETMEQLLDRAEKDDIYGAWKKTWMETQVPFEAWITTQPDPIQRLVRTHCGAVQMSLQRLLTLAMETKGQM